MGRGRGFDDMMTLLMHLEDLAPLLAMPAFMPGFRKAGVAVVSTVGQPIGLLFILLRAS